MADETVASPPRGLAPKPPPRKREWSWRSEAFRALVYQVIALAVVAFALYYLASNTFAMEWPPGSGRMAEFPEIDRVAWCSPAEARRLLKPTQHPLVDRLEAWLAGA